MLQNIGPMQLLLLLMILVMIFGANRLPQIGDGLGKAIRNLKRGLTTDDDIDVTPKDKQVSDDSSAGSKISDAEVVNHDD